MLELLRSGCNTSEAAFLSWNISAGAALSASIRACSSALLNCRSRPRPRLLMVISSAMISTAAPRAMRLTRRSRRPKVLCVIASPRWPDAAIWNQGSIRPCATTLFSITPCYIGHLIKRAQKAYWAETRRLRPSCSSAFCQLVSEAGWAWCLPNRFCTVSETAKLSSAKAS